MYYYHFISYVDKGNTATQKVDEKEQEANLLTKPIAEVLFMCLLFKVIGW